MSGGDVLELWASDEEQFPDTNQQNRHRVQSSRVPDRIEPSKREKAKVVQGWDGSTRVNNVINKGLNGTQKDVTSTNGCVKPKDGVAQRTQIQKDVVPPPPERHRRARSKTTVPQPPQQQAQRLLQQRHSNDLPPHPLTHRQDGNRRNSSRGVIDANNVQQKDPGEDGNMPNRDEVRLMIERIKSRSDAVSGADSNDSISISTPPPPLSGKERLNRALVSTVGLQNGGMANGHPADVRSQEKIGSVPNSGLMRNGGTASVDLTSIEDEEKRLRRREEELQAEMMTVKQQHFKVQLRRLEQHLRSEARERLEKAKQETDSEIESKLSQLKEECEHRTKLALAFQEELKERVEQLCLIYEEVSVRLARVREECEASEIALRKEAASRLQDARDYELSQIQFKIEALARENGMDLRHYDDNNSVPPEHIATRERPVT